jgi:2,4-dienoyl-CoA reductase-like NADH-dependent reductase (Old Yellow Enzyme family)
VTVADGALAETGKARMFEPVKIAGLDLRNRVAMSPMTRHQAAAGIPFDSDYYRRRALGGAALIVTEGVAIDHPTADYMDDCPQFATPAQLASWRRMLAGVHGAGSAMILQLWATGIRRPVARSFNPHLPSASPSGTYPDMAVSHPPSSEAEIEEIVAAFGRTALLAQQLGFDGVEIHAGHGYLVDQFFWPETNLRQDRWGGGMANRVRFATEVVREIKRRAGTGFPVLLRFSQWKMERYEARLARTPQELAAYLEPLADAGVDVFDASTRRFWIPEFEGSPLNLAGWARKLTGRPAMTVGSVGLEGPLEADVRIRGEAERTVGVAGLDRLFEMLGRGDFDLVAVGRGMLANADWANIVREERYADLSPYDAGTVTQAVV